MSKNNQSSIDWLISQLQKAKDFQRVLNQVSQTSSARIDIIATAREMYKEEHTETWNNAINALQKEKWESYQQYYNETFNCIANEI